MSKFMTAAEINKAIASIASRGKKLDVDIQTAGLSILNHVQEHGDSTLADKLVLALPKGSRKLALTEWLLAFGKLRILSKTNPDDAARIAGGAIFAYDKTKHTDLESADAKPWYDFKPEPDVLTAFDAQSAVRAVLAKLTKAQAGGLTIENRALALEAAHKLVSALSGAALSGASGDDEGEDDTLGLTE